MSRNVGKCFFCDAEKASALGGVEFFERGVISQRCEDSRSLGEARKHGIKSGNKAKIIDYCRTKFAGKLMNDENRFLYQALRAVDVADEVFGIRSGLQFESRKFDVDASEGLSDHVMQFSTDLESFIFLRAEKLS